MVIFFENNHITSYLEKSKSKQRFTLYAYLRTPCTGMYVTKIIETMRYVPNIPTDIISTIYFCN